MGSFVGSRVLAATLLLIALNVFMTFAPYARLKNLSGKRWFIAAMVSGGMARFEYLPQEPLELSVGGAVPDGGGLHYFQGLKVLSL